jgi:hypothetical protein
MEDVSGASMEAVRSALVNLGPTQFDKHRRKAPLADVGERVPDRV